jgi:hypothetical protein
VGTDDHGATEAGQEPRGPAVGRAAEGSRATGFWPAALVGHAGPGRHESCSHVGLLRERGEGPRAQPGSTVVGLYRLPAWGFTLER